METSSSFSLCSLALLSLGPKSIKFSSASQSDVLSFAHTHTHALVPPLLFFHQIALPHFVCVFFHGLAWQCLKKYFYINILNSIEGFSDVYSIIYVWFKIIGFWKPKIFSSTNHAFIANILTEPNRSKTHSQLAHCSMIHAPSEGKHISLFSCSNKKKPPNYFAKKKKKANRFQLFRPFSCRSFKI